MKDKNSVKRFEEQRREMVNMLENEIQRFRQGKSSREHLEAVTHAASTWFRIAEFDCGVAEPLSGFKALPDPGKAARAIAERRKRQHPGA